MSLTTKADFSSPALPTSAGISYSDDGIADKLAADEEFAKLIESANETFTRIAALSLEQKANIKKYSVEKNELLQNLLIEYKAINKDAENEQSLIIGRLSKKYQLNQKDNSLSIFKKAISNYFALKSKSTPFADCLALYSNGMLYCSLDPNIDFLACTAWITGLYLGCLAVLD